MQDIEYTAALVVLWTSGVHKGRAAAKYRRALKGSPAWQQDKARAVLEECNGIWPHYDEVIKNRKHCVMEMAKRAMRDGTDQFIIMGAGLDPLCFELASSGAAVYEIDIGHMELKSKLARTVAPGLKIRCICADAGEPSVLDLLKGAGWAEKRPTAIILEGISYWIPKKRLRVIADRFRTESCANTIIIEYLVPDRMVNRDRAAIGTAAFETVALHAGAQRPVRYSPDQIRKLGRLAEHANMSEMEAARTGRNRFFRAKGSGWIEVARLCI